MYYNNYTATLPLTEKAIKFTIYAGAEDLVDFVASPPLPPSDGDDDDDDDEINVVLIVAVISIISAGAVVVVIVVLIKKGIIDVSKFKSNR